MKKKETGKLKLSKDTLRQLEDTPLDRVKGAQPTTTVLTHVNSCTC
ncbi:MAG TPA: class I lanthipeptide [Thermoanaerobaculia bacterium]|jgi:hypothetical protein|nr:class I lanthipeptide [Thermoanaerobaculia bacterium]